MKRFATRWVAGFCLVGLLVGTANAGLGQFTGVEYEYDVRAMGATVGKAKLTISGFRKAHNRILRKVTLVAKTSGLGKSVYPANTTSTSWVDLFWMPVKADWDAMTPKGKRRLKADYYRRGKAGGAKGIYQRQGVKDYRTNYRLKLRPTDLVSVFALIPNAKLRPGKTLRMPMYDGWRMYDLVATVGQPTEIHSDFKNGKVKALPVVVVAKAGTIERRIVYWLDARSHEPLKVSFSYGMLGAVEAVLVKAKKRNEKKLIVGRRR